MIIRDFKKQIAFVIMLVLFSACHNMFRKESFEDKASFMEYAKGLDYGLKTFVDFPNGIKISPLFVPNDFFLLESKDKEELKDNLYLILSFSKNGKELLPQLPRGEYGVFVQTFSFGMDRAIAVFVDGDKEGIQPLMASFQPTYQMSNSNDVLVVFDKDEVLKGKNIRLVLKEFGLQTGEVTFSFDSNDIAYLSNIKILN